MKFSPLLLLAFPEIDLESIFVFYLIENMGNGRGEAERAHELFIIIVHIFPYSGISEECSNM